MPTEQSQDNPSTARSPQQPTDYTAAEGSSAAAILAFAHIAVAGVAGYGAYYLLANLTMARILAPLLMVQFLFTACFGIASYFPTDHLTRTLAVVARAAGALALGVYVVAFAIAAGQAAPPAAADHVPFGVLAQAVVAAAHLGAAGLAAFCLALAFKANMIGYNQTTTSDYFSGLFTATTGVLIAVVASCHVAVDLRGSQIGMATLLMAALGIPACRFAAYAMVRHFNSRPGLPPSIQTPLMLAATLGILALACQPLSGRPVLAALFVGSIIWGLLPFVSRGRRGASA